MGDKRVQSGIRFGNVGNLSASGMAFNAGTIENVLSRIEHGPHVGGRAVPTQELRAFLRRITDEPALGEPQREALTAHLGELVEALPTAKSGAETRTVIQRFADGARQVVAAVPGAAGFLKHLNELIDELHKLAG